MGQFLHDLFLIVVMVDTYNWVRDTFGKQAAVLLVVVLPIAVIIVGTWLLLFVL